ncbi:MAG: hypothetical protein K2N87_17930 [Eubacterium sp.]|nr:hypothetical protein [Eubacterium sp.]
MRMQQYQYAPKMPFYMSYPIQNIYMAEMEYERDMERMKELYPEDAKRIQKLVEEECDKMEYEGSMMFDEYPDRVMLKVICDRIYQIAVMAHEEPGMQMEAGIRAGLEADMEAGMAANMDNGINTAAEAEMEAEQVEALDYGWNPGRRPGPPPPPPGPWRPGPPPPPWQPGPPPPWQPGPPPPPGRPPSNNPGLGSLIEVLLYNEMYKRRCRHNRCRRWW